MEQNRLVLPLSGSPTKHGAPSLFFLAEMKKPQEIFANVRKFSLLNSIEMSFIRTINLSPRLGFPSSLGFFPKACLGRWHPNQNDQ